MAVPDFQALMLPLLQHVADSKEHSMPETRQALAQILKLSAQDLEERYSSGTITFNSRVAWAKTYLTKACLLESPERGKFHITQRGKEVLSANPSRIDNKYLERFPEFQEFKPINNTPLSVKTTSSIVQPIPMTPEEALEQAFQELQNNTADELLELVKKNSPDFFEKLVVHLLVKMGYGGSFEEAAKVTQKTADEGIDGVIKEDRLGLDTIYLQAKRWNNTVVGRPDVQSFVGALQGQKAKKGVFITTSQFSSGAIEYASRIDSRVVLIDGKTLVKLMIEHGVGVSSTATYDLKKVDTDFFDE